MQYLKNMCCKWCYKNENNSESSQSFSSFNNNMNPIRNYYPPFNLSLNLEQEEEPEQEEKKKFVKNVVKIQRCFRKWLVQKKQKNDKINNYNNDNNESKMNGDTTSLNDNNADIKKY
ncbi:MAG: hypothetical protein IJT15_01815 [Rickettsiales bacterium]|nr:hypothetical protein [Rickettsiales bacterium]